MRTRLTGRFVIGYAGGDHAIYPGGEVVYEGDTIVFVSHDYLPEARKDFAWETTVAEQAAKNVHVHDGVSEDEFVAMRRARDATLAAPALILPSLQVNVRAGALPQPSAAGHVFLKLPVNALGA